VLTLKTARFAAAGMVLYSCWVVWEFGQSLSAVAGARREKLV
jgi:hypothetical protein